MSTVKNSFLNNWKAHGNLVFFVASFLQCFGRVRGCNVSDYKHPVTSAMLQYQDHK